MDLQDDFFSKLFTLEWINANIITNVNANVNANMLIATIKDYFNDIFNLMNRENISILIEIMMNDIGLKYFDSFNKKKKFVGQL